MLNEEMDEFLVALRGVAKATRTELDKEQIRVYWGALRDIPLYRVLNACESAVKNCRFMPTPAELRERSNTAAGSWDAPPPPPRIEGPAPFDNLPPEQLERHLELLRKGRSLMSEAMPHLISVVDEIIEERAEELAGTAEGWES